MKVVVVGTGYVGLITGTCLAELGVEVVGVDRDSSKISMLNSGKCLIYEEGLPTLLEQNLKRGLLRFTTELQAAVKKCNVVFICVDTPTRASDGFSDLTNFYSAAEEIAPALRGYTIVVVKSTVPVGTGRELQEKIKSLNPSADFDLVSNPEFLREGMGVYDFMNPFRMIIGVESDRARQIMLNLYQCFVDRAIPVVESGFETAELIKYASNSFLATKITFINEMADLCEKTGADVQDLTLGMELDERIGKGHLQPGPGYGGSCFPKDTVALVSMAKRAGSPTRIIETVVDVNNKRKAELVTRIIRAMKVSSVAGKKIAILGLAFKAGTDDLRESSSIAVIQKLQEHGAVIRAHDPSGYSKARKVLTEVAYYDDVYEAVTGADGLVIATAWSLYGELEIERVKALLVDPIIIDFHNLYNAKDMLDKGVRYSGIGQGQTEKLS